MDNSTSQDADLIPDDLSGLPPWEAVPTDETEAVKTIVQKIETNVRAAATNSPARRDAHPKAHGCVAAAFNVLDNLPPVLRVGIFSQVRSYQTWIRFSNGSEKPQKDAIGDGRGMAIKLMGVDRSRSGTQDFIMINNPTFFVRNAADYVDFQNVTNPILFFFPGLNPFKFRIHELLMARRITRRIVSNPLNVQYWSMTPYLCGTIPCKFSARPLGQKFEFNDRSTPTFLHDNLVKSLQVGEAVFEFCVQIRSSPTSMPIEDPTIEWLEADSPLIPVARITIPPQTFDVPSQNAFGENLSFTPWHGLDDHRPLGGINRVRRAVYEAISKVRHEINNVPRNEPLGTAQIIPPAPLDATGGLL
ncbi:MAG: catalase family protein [Candidatus Sulfotelmatobacter sp.]